MNRLQKIFAALLIVAVAGFCGREIAKSTPVAHAQSGNPNDYTLGTFSGSLTSQGIGVVVSSVTYATAVTNGIYNLPVVSPPGFTTGSVRYQVHHVHLYASAATIVNVLEHPTTGSDITIATVGVNATTPFDMEQGFGKILGPMGYQTKAGSVIRFQNGGASTATVSGTVTGIVD